MLTRLINGERIVLSAEEEAAVRAEWAEADAKPSAPAPRDLEAEIDQLKTDLESVQAELQLIKTR